MSEQELVQKCCAGDVIAQGELYTQYAGRLLALCRRYCSDPDDAHDLMQDAMIEAVEKIHSFTYRGNGSLYSWISRIAVNMAVSSILKEPLIEGSFLRLQLCYTIYIMLS